MLNEKKILCALIIMLTMLTGSALPAFCETSLPPITSDPNDLYAVESIRVKRFLLEGNRAFSRKELAPILTPFEGRQHTPETLNDIRNRLTTHYISHGYVNSGVIIPDQKVADGIVVLKVVEGRLTDLSVTGNSWLRTHYIESRLSLAPGIEKGPLNIQPIQKRLLVMKQDPRIKNLHGEIIPGTVLGEASLHVEVEEARMLSIETRFNNYNAPSIGAYRGEIALSHQNLTGWGDGLQLKYGLTEGRDDYAARYTIPLTRYDTQLGIGAERSESTVILDDFEQIDIESKATSVFLELTQPVFQRLSDSLTVSARIENRKGETSILHKDYSLLPGEGEGGERGVSRASVVRASQSWVSRSRKHVLAIISTFSFGIDAFDATVQDNAADSRFVTWLGQSQYIRRLGWLDSQIHLRGDLRLSNDPLMAMEKFSIGGARTVRGYRENQLTTDNGVILSAEWRLPVGRFQLPWISRTPQDGKLEITPFCDYGRGWNAGLTSQETGQDVYPDPDPNSIYSVGIGLRWTLSERAKLNFAWGNALKTIDDDQAYDLQEDGIHFELYIRWY